MAGIRPITDTLRHLNNGAFLDECSDTLAQTVKKVDETGKKAQIVITLDISKATRGGAMKVVPTVVAKLPKEPASETLLFATVEGNLLTEDPHQRKLDLREVPAGQPAELKTVSQQ